ncbi:MAG: phosphoadenosine phosphosulfate reductase family protein [Oscillospiraceae bacterium]
MKDSTAMLLMMLEKQMPIDLILFCDTGLEFPAMYDHIDKVEKYIGMPITRVKAEHDYEYYFLDAPVRRQHATAFSEQFGLNHSGYGWAGPKMRWCTSVLKDTPRDRFLRPLRQNYEVIEYIGLAADEIYRLKRKRNQLPNHRHPLVDWGITEKQALDYCYSKGFDFGGLYQYFARVSCWCCPLQSLSELRILRLKFPALWQQLLDWDSKTWRNFRADYSVDELDKRFTFEEECLAKGLPIKGKAFFDALKQHLHKNEDTA